MAHEAATTSTGENRRFTRLSRWIQSEFTGMFHWLSFKKGPFPADESGELMRRYMTHKSWFDRTSSWWVEQPVLIKATYVVGFSVISAIFGLFVGASLLLGLLATVTSITMHALFVSHEKSRLEGASVFAKETIALNEQLKASQTFFQETTNELRAVIDGFHEQSSHMEEGVTLLEAEIEKVQQVNSELVSTIEDAERETIQIIIQEKAVTTHLESMSVDLEKCDHALAHTTEKVEGLGETLSRLSTITCEMKTSQKGFSQAVNRFSLFVNSLPPTSTEYINDETDEFIDSLRQQNDEDEKLIREMQLLMMFNSYHCGVIAGEATMISETLLWSSKLKKDSLLLALEGVMTGSVGRSVDSVVGYIFLRSASLALFRCCSNRCICSSLDNESTIG